MEQGLVSGSWSWRVLGTATGASFEAGKQFFLGFVFASKSSREDVEQNCIFHLLKFFCLGNDFHNKKEIQMRVR